ncbi:hypothetical protein [Agromyces laixinhei]|uniref:hypothetical protein n=1 Tax=Agromyces laixinhei TaxID=2585717 RepID=UPI0018DB0599|nr:hypothetical protein [Agromyces laixinhei]
MTGTNFDTLPETRRPQAGPPLPPLAISVIALSMISIMLPMLLAGGANYPSPFGPEEEIVGWFRMHTPSAILTALLQFAASVPLAIYAAAVWSRLNRLGVRAPGPAIGFAGGILASAAMAVSAAFTWALTRPEMLEHPELIRLLHDLAFFAGGPAYVVPFGLLVAGIAVPGLLARLLPRWLAIVGLVLAGIAMIATLVVAIPELAILLPIARFPSLAWIVACAFLLPRSRAAANRGAQSGVSTTEAARR